MSWISTAESILNLKFWGLYGKALVIFAHAVRAATLVRSRQKESQFYWLHSYVLVLLSGFGGGILTPVLLGQPSMMLVNNLLVPLSAVAWYLTHYVEGMQNFFTITPIKMLWGLGHCLFRVFTICNMVKRAHGILSPDPYYPIPLVGPIVAGVMTGTLGMFLPLNKGLVAIENRTPWPIQGALITATFYHLVMHDEQGVLGQFLRGFLGFSTLGLDMWSFDEKNVVVRIALALMWVTMQWGQTIFGPDFNIFQPLYNILYRLFNIENPNEDISRPQSGSGVEPAKELTKELAKAPADKKHDPDSETYRKSSSPVANSNRRQLRPRSVKKKTN